MLVLHAAAEGLNSELLFLSVRVAEKSAFNEVLDARHEGGEVFSFELASVCPFSHERL